MDAHVSLKDEFTAWEEPMASPAWKAWVVVGLFGTAGLVAGCNERQQDDVRDSAREVGQEVGKAARDVEDTARNAAEGFSEGVGGSGDVKDKDADIGRKEGVINDGEGPFEQRRVPGREPTILDDGKGPLEEGQNR
jgi:hypothetical protein